MGAHLALESSAPFGRVWPGPGVWAVVGRGQVGAVSYTIELPRGIYPETQYVFDLELPEVRSGSLCSCGR